jgi:hypothetical protein
MATRYEGEDGEPDLELVDAVNTFNRNEPGKGYFGKLSTLLDWHISDPVDSFEMNRNHIIYSYQKNRNPFIDHPEFVAKIWKIEDLRISKEATEKKDAGNGTKYLLVLAILILGILFFVRVLKK